MNLALQKHLKTTYRDYVAILTLIYGQILDDLYSDPLVFLYLENCIFLNGQIIEYTNLMLSWRESI